MPLLVERTRDTARENQSKTKAQQGTQQMLLLCAQHLGLLVVSSELQQPGWCHSSSSATCSNMAFLLGQLQSVLVT